MYRKERKVPKGCPQGYCCGPVLWNVLYNTLLDLDFSSHTKAIAFADYLAILTGKRQQKLRRILIRSLQK